MPDTPAGEPTPEQIRLRCWLIRLEWTPTERMKRLRCDWRPKAWQIQNARLAVSQPHSADGGYVADEIETHCGRPGEPEFRAVGCQSDASDGRILDGGRRSGDIRGVKAERQSDVKRKSEFFAHTPSWCRCPAMDRGGIRPA